MCYIIASRLLRLLLWHRCVAVSSANRYQALPLHFYFFVEARGEPGNEAIHIHAYTYTRTTMHTHMHTHTCTHTHTHTHTRAHTQHMHAHTHTHTHTHTHELTPKPTVKWRENEKREAMHSRHVKWTRQSLAAATIERKAKRSETMMKSIIKEKFKMKGGYI